MTTLIALQHEDWCVIAADSQTTGYNLSSDCSPMGKIAINGDYLVAGAGFVRGMNLIQHSFTPPAPPRSNLDRFMVSKFIPKLRKVFVDSGYDIKSDGDPASQDNEFIVAVNGVLYFIDEVYGLERTKNHLYSAGTGSQLALGAAVALGAESVTTYKEAIDILDRAVKTAIKFDIHSGGQVQMAIQHSNGETFLELLDT